MAIYVRERVLAKRLQSCGDVVTSALVAEVKLSVDLVLLPKVAKHVLDDGAAELEMDFARLADEHESLLSSTIAQRYIGDRAGDGVVELAVNAF